MPNLYGIANLAARTVISQLPQGVYWRPRYTTVGGAAVVEGASRLPDPHDPSGIARCPVCFNAVSQRSQSGVCTTCYGTTWTGGFAASRGIGALITTGTITLKLQESGDLVAVSGVWCRHDPALPILPQDLVWDSDEGVLYLVGETEQVATAAGVAMLRVIQLLPQAPDSPWQDVPIP